MLYERLRQNWAMKFGTQFLVTIISIEWLITSMILFKGFYSQAFLKIKYRFNKKLYLDVKSYKDIWTTKVNYIWVPEQ